MVWSCSPGPGLSRARRGTGVPGERVCSSRSVRGAPRLTFPPWPSGRGRKAGAGLRPLALTFGLLSPASGGVSGGRGSSDTADALASPSRRVLRERPSPRWGGLYRCCAAPPPRGCAPSRSDSLGIPSPFVRSPGWEAEHVVQNLLNCEITSLILLFSIVAVLVCIPTNSVRGFPFLHTLSNIYCL